MIRFGFAVKDRAADAFGLVFFVPSRNVALRSFADEVNRAAEDNQLYKHPDDFDLYCLGTFDDCEGVLESDLELVSRAKDLVKPA